MRQNAPNPISISIFRGNTPDPCHWGLCPQTLGEGREGMRGKEERKGEGRGGEVCVIAIGEIDVPAIM